jgi:hypothetical protein
VSGRALAPILLLTLAAGVAALPLAAARAQYKPPLRGAPGGRIGGASRSAAAPAAELPSVELLAPADHAGLTARSEPTLYYFLSRPSRWPMQFTISAPGQAAPVIDVRIPAPPAPGIYPVSLAQYRVRLLPGVDYTWSISVVVDPHAWSHNLVASAAIVSDPTQAVTPSGSTVDRAGEFAAAGLWYDAVAAAAAPNGVGRPMLDALLRQVGLQSVVAGERSAATQ